MINFPICKTSKKQPQFIHYFASPNLLGTGKWQELPHSIRRKGVKVHWEVWMDCNTQDSAIGDHETVFLKAYHNDLVN